MSERESFVRNIMHQPDDDTVRLVFADWLEERGEDERARFIRAQVWLWANQSCGTCSGPEWSAGKPCAECDQRELLRGETALSLFGHAQWREWAGAAVHLVPPGARWDDHLRFARGLLAEVTCSAESWLKHADALHWRPEQMAKCPQCAGSGQFRFENGNTVYCLGCHQLGSGRIPRPCPETAQPITHVTLTTMPVYVFGTDGRANLTGRTGSHWIPRGEAYDHSMRGIAKTLCELEWPGITFELPHAAPLVYAPAFLGAVLPAFPPGETTYHPDPGTS